MFLITLLTPFSQILPTILSVNVTDNVNVDGTNNVINFDIDNNSKYVTVSITKKKMTQFKFHTFSRT